MEPCRSEQKHYYLVVVSKLLRICSIQHSLACIRVQLDEGSVNISGMLNAALEY